MAGEEDAVSEGAALVRLGLKVALGTRGQYLADYLDDRRVRRVARRLQLVTDAAAEAGLTGEHLIERVEADDEAAELFDEVIESARGARYEAKLAYLGRCLAAALTSEDDAALDTEWLRVRAVNDLEAVHVRLLHGIYATQDAYSHRYRLLRVPDPLPGVTEWHIFTSQFGPIPRLDRSEFHAVVAVLIRNGLVYAAQKVAVDLEIEFDPEEQTAEGRPSASSVTVFAVSSLGRELLGELIDGLDLDASESSR